MDNFKINDGANRITLVGKYNKNDMSIQIVKELSSFQIQRLFTYPILKLKGTRDEVQRFESGLSLLIIA
jgi:phage-related protein